jgi:uncharacterized membrane protein YcaP (DUF421 family)
MDLSRLFIPQSAIPEIVLRGTVVYLLIFFYFRFFRRSAGAVGVSDLLLVVLIADAAQNAMAGSEQSITGGLLLVATIAFWDFLLDWLAYKFPSLRPLIEAPPLLLIRDGRIVHRNVAKQMMTTEELRAQLREHAVSGPHEVRAAFMEGDGKLSVVKKEPPKGGDDPSPGSGAGGGAGAGR